MKITKPFLCSSAQVARLLNVTMKTIQEWVGMGIAKPAHIGEGRRSRYAFDAMDVLSIALARDLRSRGYSLPLAANVCDWLLNQSLDNLREQWATGRKYLFAVGDAVCPRMLTHDAIFSNPEIDFRDAFAKGVPVAVVDLARAYQQFKSKIDDDGESHIPFKYGRKCRA